MADTDAVAESVLLTRPGRPGDVVRKVARLEREDGDVLALLEGTVRRETTLAGEEVLVEGIEEVVELAPLADLDDLRRGLDHLADRVDA